MSNWVGSELASHWDQNWRTGRDSDNGITGVQEADMALSPSLTFLLCMASGDAIRSTNRVNGLKSTKMVVSRLV